MADSPATYPELPPQLRDKSFWGMLGMFGPGAIIACVTIGSGETVFASRGGAIYGYSMLWCFVLGALCKGFQIYSGSRFITLTGRSPLQSWMELPGPRGWFVWFVAIMTCIWMPFWLAGLPAMLGDFSNWVVGIANPEDLAGFSQLSEAEQLARTEQYADYGRYWGTFYIVVALAITWLQSYGFLEKVQTAIVALLLICMVAAAAFSQPDIQAMLAGLFVPSLPDYDDWIYEKFPNVTQRQPWIEVMVYLGVIGGGAQDYFGYIGMIREKAWGMLGLKSRMPGSGAVEISKAPENLQRAKIWLRAPLVDVIIATIAILIFTVCFVVLGATVLRPEQQVPDGFKLLTEQARFLVAFAGDSAAMQFLVGWTYKTGIFFAFFGTFLGAYEIFVRTVRECIIALYPRLEALPLSKFRAWVLLYVGGGGLVLLWFLRIDPVMIITPAALVGSGLICGLWCFAMLWSDRVHVPKPLRMPLPMKIGVIIAGLVLTIGPSIGLIEYVKQLSATLSGS